MYIPKKHFKTSYALKLYCLFVLHFIFVSNTGAQNIEADVKRYNYENGLSSYANYIHKDSRGVIWIGTQFGLYRQDSQGFVHFSEKDGLPFRQVMEIFEDAAGWFWLYRSCRSKPNCKRDLAFFHPLTKETMTFKQRFGGKVSIKADQVLSIGQDSTSVYFTADRKLLIWSLEKGIREIPIKGVTTTPVIWTKINDQVLGAYIPDYMKINSDLDNVTFQYLAFDIDGNLRQSPVAFPVKEMRHVGLNQLRRRYFQFDKLLINKHKISFSSEGALITDTVLFELPHMIDEDNYVYFDERFFVKDDGEIYHTGLSPDNEVKNLFEESVENFSDSTKNTATVWVKDKTILPDQERFYQALVLRGDRHRYFDRETNTAWRAHPNGVETYTYRNQLFQAIKVDSSGKQLARGVIAIDDDLFLFAYKGNLYGVTKTSDVKIISFSDVDYKGIRKLAKEENDTLIWTYNNQSLFQLDLRNFELSQYDFPDFFAPHSIYKNGNQIWIGGDKAIYRYFIEQDSFALFLKYDEHEESQNKIHFFKKTLEGHFWVGTNNGLFWCSEEKGILVRYGNMETGDRYLPASDFYHMSVAKAGGYWLATMNGLLHLTIDKAQKTSSVSPPDITQPPAVTHHLYSTSHDLPTNEILAAYEDNYGFVWMPTPHGLIQFQIHTALFKTYLKSDGLSHSSFQEYAHSQSADGTLIFGGYDGYNVFHPKDFKNVNFLPEVPLIILDYEQHVGETDKIEYRLQQLTKEGKIVLQPGDKFFSIRMGLTDYRISEKHRFAYKIEGYQEEWYEDRSNLIRISGLPYGSYVLKIKGRLHDGRFARPVMEIPVSVLKPFYLKTGFFITAFAILLLSSFLFYQWRIRKLKGRQKELEKMVKERTERIEEDKQIIEQQANDLQQLDKVKSRFFANVSHELRTPLTLILGPVNTLLKKGLSTQNPTRLLDTIKQNGKILLQLVNEILDLSKMESGKLEVYESPTILYLLIHRVVSYFESHAERQNINFQLEYKAKQDLQISLDQDKFQKILNNLLSNAFKFTPKRGKIKVTLTDLGSHINLEVIDSGRGIHPDDLPHVFDRFYQSKQANAAVEGGTGIGLALCREYARLFDAELSVESELGKGSRFTFEFPKKEVFRSLPDEAAADLKNTKGMASYQKGESDTTESLLGEKEHLTDENFVFEGRNNRTILLVEDNHSLRDYLQLILEPHYNVLIAENGQEAIEYLKTTAEQKKENAAPFPSLIVSDIMMPVMDGFQLLEKLKSSDKWRFIPIIMLTARAELSDKIKALRIGVDDYLTKPFEEEELLARVENILLNNARKNQFKQESQEQLQEINDDRSETDTPSIPLSKSDMEWLETLEETTTEKLGNFNFSVEQLAYEMATSRWQLNRRIKLLTGLTARQYILESRLNRARTLLEDRNVQSIKALTYTVGVKDLKNFSRQFKRRFGKLPSEYL